MCMQVPEKMKRETMSTRVCVHVCVSMRERGDGSRGCLIGKQMNNVSLGWRRKGDRNKCCVYRRERERVILVV